MSKALENLLIEIENNIGKDDALRAIEGNLTLLEKQQLKKISTTIQQSLIARNSIPAANELLHSTERLKPILLSDVDESMGVLLLLALVIHHSDTLTYLPYEIRDDRLSNWAVRTNLPINLVKEATYLGPAVLNALVDAA